MVYKENIVVTNKVKILFIDIPAGNTTSLPIVRCTYYFLKPSINRKYLELIEKFANLFNYYYFLII